MAMKKLSFLCRKRKLKRRKWYRADKYTPDVKSELVIQTDMGYVFEAVYQNGKWLISTVRDGKVYFEPWINSENIWRWMKI